MRRPQSNGFVERLHRTLLHEHLRIDGHKNFYESIEHMQKNLDAYLVSYNTKRPHRGCGMKDRTRGRTEAGAKPDFSQEKKEEKMNPKQAV